MVKFENVLRNLLMVTSIIGCLAYTHLVSQSQHKAQGEQQRINANTRYSIDSIGGITDSLEYRSNRLAESVLYLDSCQQAKMGKSDRAEKRGRFIGGLLKGLFPSLH